MTDTERLNWLEENEGLALVSDDFGNWAVVTDGCQNVPLEPGKPSDITTSFWIEKKQWRPSVREAIDAAIQGEDEQNA